MNRMFVRPASHINRAVDASLARSADPANVCSWPIATNFSLAPDVSFWGEADLGRAAEFAASVENDPACVKTYRLL
jgi:hypothetical protein